MSREQAQIFLKHKGKLLLLRFRPKVFRRDNVFLVSFTPRVLGLTIGQLTRNFGIIVPIFHLNVTLYAGTRNYARYGRSPLRDKLLRITACSFIDSFVRGFLRFIAFNFRFFNRLTLRLSVRFFLIMDRLRLHLRILIKRCTVNIGGKGRRNRHDF